MTSPIVRMALCLVLLPAWARGAEPSADQKKIDELTAQVDALKAELAAVKAENAALKQKATSKPPPDAAPAPFELGAEAKLGAYKYKTPVNWAASPPKDAKTGMLYRSPDKTSVIFVQVKPKGAAPAEMQQKYAQQVVQMLKQDFAKSKTEIVEPPTAQPDPRFYLKVHESIRVNGGQVADQTHYYLMAGKDMIELSVITKSEDPATISATQRLAEDLLLSVKSEK
jgi:hypothetical protein